MDEKLRDVFEGKEGNYLLPFFWMHEGNRAGLPERIQKVWESGCRAFCVESRPYGDFCGPEWWIDMETILEEAGKRDMKVWILDDKHFPTGFANGLVKRKYPERRRWFLREHHTDLMGPMKDASLLVPPCGEEETLLAVCAYRRTGHEEEVSGEPVVLPVRPGSPFLYWNVPEGCWRVFFLYKTRKGCGGEYEWSIDMLSRDSVQVLLEAVYEPHYRHFGKYFGNTLAGFFSDEPGLYCHYVGPWGQDPDLYRRTVGQPGVALPWSDEIPEILRSAGISDPLSALPGLWYPIRGKSPSIRLAFMDAVTGLWSRNFSHQLGDWCRRHGVRHIGHIIEDNGAHARLGCSGGHYFRSLDGQDMSGIDIVLHQVMPGMADYPTAARISGGVTDPDFFHCILAQLAASQSRITPHMEGRALCEVFGAFGWAESVPFMKWLIDFLLVRGINHFVPHAFTDLYPDPDCPPHFYADGNDPQFSGFTKLMKYTNRAAHLLFGTDRQADGAVLYRAEAEWMNGGDCMPMEKPAKALSDAQIDYDILPADALENARAENGRMTVNGHSYRFLAVPSAEYLPERFWRAAARLHREGVPLFFLEPRRYRVPDFCGALPGETVSVPDLVPTVRKRKLAHDYKARADFLRISRFRRGSASCFMLFNESAVSAFRTEVRLPCAGDYLRLDLLDGVFTRANTRDGAVPVDLVPGQSEILFFDTYGADFLARFPKKTRWKKEREISGGWEISLLELGKEKEYRAFRRDSELFNVTGPEGRPDFSGLIRYRTEFSVDKAAPMCLDLGRVGFTARVILNGKDLGLRICAPYRWDVGGAVRAGANSLEIVAANTLVQRLKDPFSVYMPIPPSGVTGPVSLLRMEQE